MDSQRILYFSAEGNEFHLCPPEERRHFLSYRQALKLGLRVVSSEFVVVSQDELAAEEGIDLLHIDQVISQSFAVVHLTGKSAGASPSTESLEKLRSQYPELLRNQPALHEALTPDAAAKASLTQWEAYLALHHGKPCLIYDATPEAPRSPLFAESPEGESSEEEHRRRLAQQGLLGITVRDPGDFARKTLRRLLQLRLAPEIDPVETTPEALEQAHRESKDIIDSIVSAIQKPNLAAMPIVDPANVAIYWAALQSVAEKWRSAHGRLSLSSLLEVILAAADKAVEAAQTLPTPETLIELARTHLALGEFSDALLTARRATDLAVRLRREDPDNARAHGATAIQALQLIHTAASASHALPQAIASLEEAAQLINKEEDPVGWADLYEPVAEFVLNTSEPGRAEELVNELVDIREEYQEDSPALAGSLLLWTRLLHAQRKFPGMESVAARAERILSAQKPPHLPSVASALSARGVALATLQQFPEAESNMRRALEMVEQTFGPENPHISNSLGNLSQLMLATNRADEAGPLMQRHLNLLLEVTRATEHPHPHLEIAFRNYIGYLQATGKKPEEVLEELRTIAPEFHFSTQAPE